MRFALSILAVALVMLFAHVFFLRFLPGGDAVTLRLCPRAVPRGIPDLDGRPYRGNGPRGRPRRSFRGASPTTTFPRPHGPADRPRALGTPAEPLSLEDFPAFATMEAPGAIRAERGYRIVAIRNLAMVETGVQFPLPAPSGTRRHPVTIWAAYRFLW